MEDHEDSLLEFEVVPDTPPEKIPKKKRWYYHPTEESKYWSKNVLDFYVNGDSSFCYCGFLGRKKLGSEFWGALLGYENHSYLSPLHVDGWVTRMMRFRWILIKKSKKPEQLYPWTILPLQFLDLLCEKPNYGALPFAIGLKEHYPPFWDIDMVYIPICVELQDWFIIRVDMRTLHLTLYFTGKSGSTSSSDGSNLIQVRVYPTLVKFEALFKSFLDQISYWEHSGRPFVEKTMVTHTEVCQQCKENPGANSGVLVCMLLTNLVNDEQVSVENDLEEACAKYRRHMADEFYAARFTPGNV
ncbi:hypothetical protein Hdeb2414_s0004g00150691 [Helianthus debilis subsp. tardiflorus]